MAATVQLNARVPKEIAEEPARLADLSGRKQVWHITEALRAYLAAETEFITAVEQGRADARAGRTRDFAEYAAEARQRIDQRSMPS
jgi:predicted transcriptional regulator